MPAPIGIWRGLTQPWRALRWWRFSKSALIRRVRELQAENRAAVGTIAAADARAARADERLREAQAAGVYFKAQSEYAQRRLTELEMQVRDLQRRYEEARPD